LILRAPQGEEEEEYVKKRKGSVYKVAFRPTGPKGGLLLV